jgi:hypothetical protein
LRLSRRAALRAAPALALLGHGLPVLAERPERPQLSLAVGGKTALCYLPLTVAEQLKFFAAEGLEVELQDHASGARAEQALIQGQADLRPAPSSTPSCCVSVATARGPSCSWGARRSLCSASASARCASFSTPCNCAADASAFRRPSRIRTGSRAWRSRARRGGAG